MDTTETGMWESLRSVPEFSGEHAKLLAKRFALEDELRRTEAELSKHFARHAEAQGMLVYHRRFWQNPVNEKAARKAFLARSGMRDYNSPKSYTGQE